MNLVVGLGNPGKKYARTPHNVGFDVVDLLAQRWGGRFKNATRHRSLLADVVMGGERVILVKPQTFMNLSGEAVSSVANYYRCDAKSVLVVMDDVHLDFGRLRVRRSGGTGGHRGLASVIERLASGDIARVRLGIGSGYEQESLVDHVLSPFTSREWETMRETVSKAADAVEYVLEHGVESAMNRFNGSADENDQKQESPESSSSKSQE